MSRAETLLKLLADGRFRSGEEIGASLGVSRTAIWHSIRELEALGIGIDAVSGRGYRLQHSVELFDKNVIMGAIAPSALSKLKSLEILFSIDSTNTYLAKTARNGVNEAFVCLAELQTAARGRRGNAWHSPLGANLYVSVAWGFGEGPGRLSGLSLALAVACAQALKGLGVPGVQLKWPNDIWLGKKKLAGLLLDVKGEANGPCQLIAGLGVNIGMPAHAPIDQPWADLKEVSPSMSRNVVAGVLVGTLVEALHRFSLEGFAPFRRAWPQLDGTIDHEVRVHLANGFIDGKAAGIDESGALLLVCETGLKRFTAGEVSLRLRDHVAPVRRG